MCVCVNQLMHASYLVHSSNCDNYERENVEISNITMFQYFKVIKFKMKFNLYFRHELLHKKQQDIAELY